MNVSDEEGLWPVLGSKAHPEHPPIRRLVGGEAFGSIFDKVEELIAPPDVPLGRPTGEWVFYPVVRGKNRVETGSALGREFLHAQHVGSIPLTEQPQGRLSLGPFLGAPEVIRDH
jgi:hypothetical protein